MGDLIFTFLGGQGDLFFGGVAFFRNCGSISKIVGPAFEMMMNSRVASVKQIVISAYSTIFAKLGLDLGVEKKAVSEGVKPPTLTNIVSAKRFVCICVSCFIVVFTCGCLPHFKFSGNVFFCICIYCLYVC